MAGFSRKNQWCTVGLIVAVVLTGSCGDDDGTTASGEDMGGGDGLFLTDTSPSDEMFQLTPNPLAFEEPVLGETQIVLATIENRSTNVLEIHDIALSDTTEALRFTNDFLGFVGRSFGWVDSNTDGHGFEEREEPLLVDPGESFEVELQLRPVDEQTTCLDRPPSPCGFLVVTGVTNTIAVPIDVPR